MTLAKRIVKRDAKSKSGDWLNEHVPKIVLRDGKSAFERSRKRALQNETLQKPIKPLSMLEKVSYEPIEKLKRIICTYQLDKYKSYAKPDVDSLSNSISGLILQRHNYKMFLLVHTRDIELASGRSSEPVSLVHTV